METKTALILGAVGFIGLYELVVKKYVPQLAKLENENKALRGHLNGALQKLAYPDYAARQQKYGAMPPTNPHVQARQNKYAFMKEMGFKPDVLVESANGFYGGISPKMAGLPTSASVLERRRKYGMMSLRKTKIQEMGGFQRDTVFPLTAAQTEFNMK